MNTPSNPPEKRIPQCQAVPESPGSNTPLLPMTLEQANHLLSINRELEKELAALRQANRPSLLTPRQLEVLKLVANGKPRKQIANVLHINVRTVQREIRQIFDRLGVDDAPHAVAVAYRQGLIRTGQVQTTFLSSGEFEQTCQLDKQTEPPRRTAPSQNWELFEGQAVNS